MLWDYRSFPIDTREDDWLYFPRALGRQICHESSLWEFLKPLIPDTWTLSFSCQRRITGVQALGQSWCCHCHFWSYASHSVSPNLSDKDRICMEWDDRWVCMCDGNPACLIAHAKYALKECESPFPIGMTMCILAQQRASWKHRRAFNVLCQISFTLSFYSITALS